MNNTTEPTSVILNAHDVAQKGVKAASGAVAVAAVYGAAGVHIVVSTTLGAVMVPLSAIEHVAVGTYHAVKTGVQHVVAGVVDDIHLIGRRVADEVEGLISVVRG